jgi:trigger factor
MNITQQKTDDLTATITLHIEKNDYEPLVKKNLNDCRRKADIKGFRPGMAPMSLIEKMHKRTALIEEINKLLQEHLSKYIEENKLNLLGEPVPEESHANPEEWENPDKFEFVFEIGLAPEIAFTLSKEDIIPFYTITVTEEEKAKQRDAILKQNKRLVPAETIIGEDDFLIVDLVQGEKTIEGTYLMLHTVEDPSGKDLFSGKKAGDELVADVKKLIADEKNLAGLLKVAKEELDGIDPVFTIKIKEVQQFAAAELNQELYDSLYGKDAVTDEAGFMQKIEADIREEYAHESDYRFSIDAQNALLEKANIKLPEAFLKRWLQYSSEGKITPDVIEKEFPDFADDMRRQMIRDHILEEQKIVLEYEDLLNHAKKMARYQFSMYGIRNAAEEQITHYAQSILANEKEVKRIYAKVKSDKVIDYVKSAVTLDVKEITLEELQKLYEK